MREISKVIFALLSVIASTTIVTIFTSSLSLPAWKIFCLSLSLNFLFASLLSYFWMTRD